MENTTQIRFVAHVILPEGSMRRGSVKWFGIERARHLIDIGVAKLVESDAVTLESRVTADPSEKKFSGAAPDGLSTDSLVSSEPGAAPSLFASLAEQASQMGKSIASRVRGKKGKTSDSSQ